MIPNIEKYAAHKHISLQDAFQAFLQVIVLKNVHLKNIALIGGTSLVIGQGNPRFSEDIDLTGIPAPKILANDLKRAEQELTGLMAAAITITPPKKELGTWRLACRVRDGLSAKLHIDTQPYPPFSHYPLMVEYPGIMPFVFPSVELGEIMADKLIALAFRKNLSGRDIFDLWYHWLKDDKHLLKREVIISFISKKLKIRSLKTADFLDSIKVRLKHGPTKRVEDEWQRYLPAGLKDNHLYKQIFSTVERYLAEFTL